MRISDSGLVPAFFVAFHHADEAYKEVVCKTLGQLGFSEYSMSDNLFGESYRKRIDRELEQCACLIPLLTGNWSTWIETEIEDARRLGKTVLPILCGPDTREIRFPTGVDSGLHHLRLKTPGSSAFCENLIDSLLQAGLLDDGILPRGMFSVLRDLPMNLLGDKEQFACELIEQPVCVSREGGHITLELDRRSPDSCEYVAISNRGKKLLQRHFVTPRRESLEERDSAIRRLMTSRVETRDPDGAGPGVWTPGGLPLRWASGGVLPVVNFRERRWVALLFRDIPPYGWNLPLGASERYSSAPSSEEATSLWEQELRRPERLVTREFLEEILVLNRHPRRGRRSKIRRFQFVHELQQFVEDQSTSFSSRHINMRKSHDLLTLIDADPANDSIEVSETQAGTCTISVESTDGRYAVHGFHVSVNLLEMGIEMILPIEFSLNDDDYLLDGEILRVGGEEELVRMPIGLFSLDYLSKAFARDRELSYELPSAGTRHPRYEADESPPSVFSMVPLSAEDVFLFDWDVGRREELAAAQELDGDRSTWERHQIWVDLFGSEFASGPESLPTYFTPATAKALQAVLPELPHA